MAGKGLVRGEAGRTFDHVVDTFWNESRRGNVYRSNADDERGRDR